MTAWRSRGLGTWMLALAAAAALYAALISWFGGFDAEFGAIRLRSRDATRPAVLSAAAFILFLVIDHRRARRALAAAWTAVDSRRASGALLGAAMVWTAVAGISFNTRAAGGSDSYGYISQVRLLSQGRLVDHVPLDHSFRWRDAARTLVPYGYVPAADAGRMAPQYPPGLPLLMLPASLAGESAIYLVVPAFGMLLVLCVWLAGLRIGDPLAAGIAAVMTAASPTFLYQLVQPMSDVPAAALWLAALLAVRQGRRGDILSGFLIGLALLVRPNLAPLAAIVFLSGGAQSGWTLRQVAGFAAPIALCAGFLMYVQLVRYGSPLASGYGSMSDLFGSEYVSTNLRQYSAWVTAAHGPTIWLALLAPFALTRAQNRIFGAALLVFAAAVWGLYLPYIAFQPDEWHYTRFLLPAIAVMLLLSAVVMMRGVRFLLPDARIVVAGAVIVAVLFVMGRAAVSNGALDIHEAERKYPAAARAVVLHVGEGAWVLAGQHSGSLRYYAGSQTVRWDLVHPGDLDLVVDALRSRGVRPIVVLDPGEVDPFRKRFAGARAAASMRLIEIAEETRLYALE